MELEIESRNVAMPPRWKTEIEARRTTCSEGMRCIFMRTPCKD